ncbi:ParB/Srx family N-terminal domain-containing protein [Curtobacterium sp. RRHDQ10]|uniref:ParB/Srx family N-terminal domain-containing protein n=1 Tax=Curtobacterium phyllosphaerae TaxID=3413379 RepID=UPI003BEFDC4F
MPSNTPRRRRPVATRHAVATLLASATLLTAVGGSALAATGAAAAAGTAAATTPVTDVPAASCSATSAPTDPYLCATPDDLVDVRIGDVHPTQPSLGYDEVYYKLGRYSAAISKDAVDKEFGDWCEANGQHDAVSAQPGATLRDPSTFTCDTAIGAETADDVAAMKTVVIGPGGTLWLTDGHHTLTSFDETPDGGPDTHVRVRVLGNLSGLGEADFWSTMRTNGWVWLRDLDGNAITPSQLPTNVGLEHFEDDRARSIMYFARDVGYSADGAVPFQEFYWGAWLRAHPELGLADWDQDDWAESLALVRTITEAQVALPRDSVVDPESGSTAADLSTFTAWNDGKKETKGEWDKLAKPYSDAKPGKLAYMVEYRRTLSTGPTEPTDPGTTPTDPGTTAPGPGTTPTDPGTTPPTAGTGPTTPGTTPPTDPGTTPSTARGAVQVTGTLRPGGTVVVTGTGFAPSTSGIRVELRPDQVLLGTVMTDASGAFRLTATIPRSVATGAHTVVVLVDGTPVAVDPVTISAGSSADRSSLAFTGSRDAVPAAVVAGLLLLAGTSAAVVATRRKRA